MANQWQYIPRRVISTDIQRQQADEWATTQRQKLADEWAQGWLSDAPPITPSPESEDPESVELARRQSMYPDWAKRDIVPEVPEDNPRPLEDLAGLATSMSPVRRVYDITEQYKTDPEGAREALDETGKGLVMGMSGGLKMSMGGGGGERLTAEVISKMGDRELTTTMSMLRDGLKGALDRVKGSSNPNIINTAKQAQANVDMVQQEMMRRVSGGETITPKLPTNEPVGDATPPKPPVSTTPPKYFYAAQDQTAIPPFFAGTPGRVKRFTSKAERDAWVADDQYSWGGIKKQAIEEDHHWAQMAKAIEGEWTSAGKDIILVSEDLAPGYIRGYQQDAADAIRHAAEAEAYKADPEYFMKKFRGELDNESPVEPTPPSKAGGTSWTRDADGRWVRTGDPNFTPTMPEPKSSTTSPQGAGTRWTKNERGEWVLQGPDKGTQPPQGYRKPSVEVPPGYTDVDAPLTPANKGKGEFQIPPAEESSFTPNLTKGEQGMGQRLRDITGKTSLGSGEQWPQGKLGLTTAMNHNTGKPAMTPGERLKVDRETIDPWWKITKTKPPEEQLAVEVLEKPSDGLSIMESAGGVEPPSAGTTSGRDPIYVQKRIGARKLWDRITTTIAAQGEHGKQIASLMEQTRDMGEQMAGGWVYQLKPLWKLSEKEFVNLVDVAEGVAAPISTKVSQAAQLFRTIDDAIQAEFQSVDEAATYLQNHFPHIFDSKIFKDVNQMAKAAKGLVDSGKAVDLDEAHEMLRHMGRPIRNRVQGNLEKHRMLDLPNYEKTPEALKLYIEQAAHRIAGLRVLGKNDANVMRLIKQMNTTGKDGEGVLQLFNTAVTPQYDEMAQTISGALRGFNTFTKMGLGAVSNLTQTANTATVVGGGRAAKATVSALKDEESWDFATRIGVILDGVIGNIRSGTGNASGLVGKLGAPGFTKVEKFDRVIAAVGGRDYAIDMAKAAVSKPLIKKWAPGQAAKALDMLGLDSKGIISRGGELTQAEIDTAARSVVKRTQ
jgi:hypothetical protein